VLPVPGSFFGVGLCPQQLIDTQIRYRWLPNVTRFLHPRFNRRVESSGTDCGSPVCNELMWPIPAHPANELEDRTFASWKQKLDACGVVMARNMVSNVTCLLFLLCGGPYARITEAFLQHHIPLTPGKLWALLFRYALSN